MKKLLSVSLLMLVLVFGSTQEAKASHGAAFQITYEHVQGLTYKLYFTFYRECSGISEPSSISVTATSLSGCAPNQSISLQKVGMGNGTQVPIQCVQASSVCTYEWKYEGTITLSQPCSDWVFYHTSGARPANDNLQAQYSYYVEAFLNNQFAPTQSSPQWNNPVAVRDFCVGVPAFFDQSVSEPDGDSLYYTLMPAKQNNMNTDVIYTPPYSATNQVPLQGGTQMVINPVTQAFEFTPGIQFSGSFCFMVEEWSFDTTIFNQGQPNQYTVVTPIKVGHIMRDLRMIFEPNCQFNDATLTNTTNDSIVDPFTGTYKKVVYASCGDTNIWVAGEGAALACGSVAADGSDFFILDPNTGTPSANFVNHAFPDCQGGSADSIYLGFNYPLNSGYYYIIVKNGNDLNSLVTNCGEQMDEFKDTVVLYVDPSFDMNLPSQLTSCIPSGGYPSINAAPADINITWTDSATGTVIDTTNNVTFTQSGVYYFSGEYSGCSGAPVTDTVYVTLLEDPIIDLPDTAVMCKGNPITLDPGTDQGYTYTWTFSGFQTGTDTMLLTNLGVGTYVVTVTNGQCVATDQTYVDTLSSLIIDITATADTICETEGDVRLTFNHLSQPSGSVIEWDGNPNANGTYIDVSGGTHYVNVVSPQGCEGGDTIKITVVPQGPSPEIFCTINGEQLEFNWQSQSGISSYEVSLDGGATWVPANGSNGLSHLTPLSQETINVRGVDANSRCDYTLIGTSDACNQEIIVPNVITPNGDGDNDALVIEYLDLYPGSELLIFDRWGRKVFEATDYKNDWDGGDNADGTYFYILNITDPDNTVLKGTITLFNNK